MNDEDAILIICLFTATIIGGIIMGTGDAEGAGTPMWEPNEYLIDESPLNGPDSSWAARGPDNIVRRAWQDDDYALVVSYTSNNGSTWADSEVVDSAWKGHTSIGIGGIVVLANNTTIVHFNAAGADDNYNSYIACRWNWLGSWEIIKIYGGTTIAVSNPKMTLNETKLLLTYSWSNAVYYKLFTLSDWTITPLPGNLPGIWIQSFQGMNGQYDVTVNQTGYFILCLNTWSGAQYRYYIRDLELTHAVVYAVIPSAVWTTEKVSIMSTSDDGFSVVASVLYTGMSYYGIIVFHNHAIWGAFSNELVNWRNDYLFDTASTGTCINDNDRVTIYWANDTGSGGGVNITKATTHYQDAEEDWEEAMVDQVYDYGTDDDVWWTTGWYDQKYPVVGGYSVNIPDTGWMGHHIWKDEVGSPDDYGFALYWNATFHWYDWSPPDPGPGLQGDDEAGDEQPFTIDEMGELWVLLAVTAVLVGLARTYKMHVYRKRW